MADTHPIYQRPVIHCGKCGHQLIHRATRISMNEDIQAGRAVLGECNLCCVAVSIPAEMLRVAAPVDVATTIAHRWPTPQAKLTDEQKKMLGGAG